MVKPLILVAEDEESIARLIEYNLTKSGYEVLIAYDGGEALDYLKDYKPDLILLDRMLPVFSGTEICGKIRKMPKFKNIPIIMVTAKSEEVDKVTGLDSGADDYITKPFSPLELIARIKAVLRRIRPAFSDDILKYGDFTVNNDVKKITYKGTILELSNISFNLLSLLLERNGKALSREYLLNNIWGSASDAEIRVVDTTIKRLRGVLNSASEGAGDLIKTVRSVGYMIDSGNRK